MADPNTTPKERIRVFRRDGTPVAEFRAQVARSWVIGDESRLQFTYPSRKTDIVNEDVIQFGYWIVVRSDSIPSWVGVIDTPRQWSTRNVTVCAYSPERVFDWRIGPLEETITGSAGTIFETLIAKLNLAEQTVIRAGQIWRGGVQRQEVLNPTPLKQNLRQLWERSGEDYTWRHTIGSDNKLIVYGDWVPFLGVETSAMLHEGKGGGNIEAVGQVMVEDGPIINSFLAYGNGETWQSRPSVTITAPGSIGRFGLRESGEEFRDTTATATLTENAQQRVYEFRNPARSFTLAALNVGETFQHIQLGNILKLQLQNVGLRASGLGFIGRVRIIGMSYDPAHKNKIKLVVREVV